MDSLAGYLLIAVPELPDANFFRSVVLVLQHSDAGAFGVVLNRPSDVSVAKIWEEISDSTCSSDLFVNIGGPVEGPLIGLHSNSTLGEVQVLPGLFMSLQRENLNRLVRQDESSFRIYNGYAGWGSMQLDSEMESGGWLTINADHRHVFESPDVLWQSVCERVGHSIMLPNSGSRPLPSDPSLN